MFVNVNCPKCDNELEFEHTSDMQGDGVWATNVDCIDLTAQNCQCSFTDEEMDELRDKVYTMAQESEPYFSMIY